MLARKKIPRPALSGFDEIQRNWNTKEGRVVVKILPGEYYVTTDDEQINTVLGSCVSACVRDRTAGIGGMNHFMLPETSGESLREGDAGVIGKATRYGNYAMEHLINTILQNGGRRKNLEIKLFGGGRIISNMTDIGTRNIEFVLGYVNTENLDVSAQDMGDIYPRRVLYYPKTGKVRVKKLQTTHGNQIIERESQYRRTLKDDAVEGEVELF